MSKVKMGMDRLGVMEQVERARVVVQSMTGNLIYPSPNPTLVVAKGIIDALELAYQQSRGKDREKIALLRLRRKEMLAMTVQLAAYVQEASGGDEEKILSSGFDVQGRGNLSVETPAMVGNLRLRDGAMEHSLRALWNKTAGALVYIVECSTTADFSANVSRYYTSKTQKKLGNYSRGTICYVRVQAIGRENAGDFSQVVTLLVR